MRVLVFGAGALGSLVGGLLAPHAQVTLLGREPHMSAIAARGLVLSGEAETVRMMEVSTEAEQALAGGPDIVLVTVKGWDTLSAARLIGRHWKGGGILLSMQNGLGNLEELEDAAGPGRTVLGCTTGMGAYLEGAGEVRYAGKGLTRLGVWRPPPVENGASGAEESLQEVVDLFLAAGLEAEATRELGDELWTKAIINSAINPLMAISGHRNGYLLRDPALMGLAREVCVEGVSVAVADGAGVSKEAVAGRMEDIVSRTAGNKCSMLQDVERGRRTEVDRINGEIARRGESCGVPAPLNRALTALVKGLEPSTFS